MKTYKNHIRTQINEIDMKQSTYLAKYVTEIDRATFHPDVDTMQFKVSLCNGHPRPEP